MIKKFTILLLLLLSGSVWAISVPTPYSNSATLNVKINFIDNAELKKLAQASSISIALQQETLSSPEIRSETSSQELLTAKYSTTPVLLDIKQPLVFTTFNIPTATRFKLIITLHLKEGSKCILKKEIPEATGNTDLSLNINAKECKFE